MPTIAEACTILRVSHPTLKKYLEFCKIKPKKHHLDGRFYTISDEDLHKIADMLAQRPGNRPVQRQPASLGGHITQAPRFPRPESHRSASQEANLTPPPVRVHLPESIGEGQHFGDRASAARWLTRHGVHSEVTPKSWPGWRQVELTPSGVLGLAIALYDPSNWRINWRLHRCSDPACVCQSMLLEG